MKFQSATRRSLAGILMLANIGAAADIALRWKADSLPVDGYNLYYSTTPFSNLTLAQARAASTVTRVFVRNPRVDIGVLPQGLSINWPAEPTITRDVDVRTIEEWRQAILLPGTRIHIRANITEQLDLRTSNTEIVAHPGVKVGGLRIGLRAYMQDPNVDISRIRVRGGEWDHITVSGPWSCTDGCHNFANWVTTDVIVEGAKIQGGAMSPEGRRILFLHNQVFTQGTALWAAQFSTDDGVLIPMSDIIVGGNVFVSQGKSQFGNGAGECADDDNNPATPPSVPCGGCQATSRMHSPHRTVLVGNYFSNAIDGFIPPPRPPAPAPAPFVDPPDQVGNACHNYRIHDEGRDNFFARNVLVNSGAMFGRARTGVQNFWFNDNVLYHGGIDMFNPGGIPGTDPFTTLALHVHGNRIHTTGEQDRLVYGTLPAHWSMSDNRFAINVPSTELQAMLPPRKMPTLLPPGGIIDKEIAGLAASHTYYFRYSRVDLTDIESELSHQVSAAIAATQDSIALDFDRIPTGAKGSIPQSNKQSVRKYSISVLNPQKPILRIEMENAKAVAVSVYSQNGDRVFANNACLAMAGKAGIFECESSAKLPIGIYHAIVDVRLDDKMVRISRSLSIDY